jgi:hypothetical protein
VKAKIPENFAL